MIFISIINFQTGIMELEKNQIFLAPFGCGKNYNLVIETMRILGSQLINPDKNYKYSTEEYTALLNEFEEKKKYGYIETVRFYETYSYKDFIEEKVYLNNTSTPNLYIINDGCFKKFTNSTIYESIDIPKEKIKTLFSFENLLGYLKEVLPAGAFLQFENSHFEIVRYSDKSLIIRTDPKTSMIELQYNILAQLIEATQQQDVYGAEILSILHSQQGKGIYYNAILSKISNFCINIKKQMVKEYFKGAYKLKEDNIKPFVFIIEDIDNCNISEVFGETLSLLEEENRAHKTVKLMFSQEKFIIPQNLYIIGTITLPSHMTNYKNWNLLIEKFSIKRLNPCHTLVADFNCNFSQKFKILNDRITMLLDENHQMGHNYFLVSKYADCDINDLQDLWFKRIQPKIKLYFKNDFDKLQILLGNARTDNLCFIKKDEKTNCYNWVSPDSEGFDFEAALNNAFNQ